MRIIKAIYQAVSAPIDDLITYRALPTSEVNYIDPFLFLNHHGPQDYPPHNNGLPFGPHPHRGFETLTFVIDGDVVHRDSGGGSDRITAGGVQWMTAGSGLIHSEVSSKAFMEKGGREEILQLWMNLPAKHKMVKPAYKGLQYNGIKHILLEDEKTTINLISGKWENESGPVDSLSGLTIASIEMQKGGQFSTQVEASHNIFFYVVRGTVEVNGRSARMYQLVEFENNDETLEVSATEDSILLFGHAQPFHEPVAAQGPFVMNTSHEIAQAYADFRAGKMGVWSNE